MNRQAREKAGRRAENLVAWYLRAKGYRILERRVKTRSGEIDLIARKGHALVIVEVKQRQSLETAEISIPPQAWKRIHAAAQIYLSKNPKLAALGLRFDAVFVIGRWKIDHRPDFWRVN